MLLARLYDVANAAAYAEADSHCLCQNSKENDLYFSLKSYSFGTFLNVFHWATLYVNEANAPTSISPDINDSATSIKSKMVFIISKALLKFSNFLWSLLLFVEFNCWFVLFNSRFSLFCSLFGNNIL